jgi:hypothetical protein
MSTAAQVAPVPGSRRAVAVVLAGVMVASLAGSIFLLRHIDRLREGATLEEVLYLPSARALKGLSLGYTGLMADLYWTRAVQYFGSKHAVHSRQYKLLAPLLDITTTLDPHLVVAYRFGSTFLAQKPPEGAGDPQKAVELIERGIRENPDTWQLYFELGFLEYMELHDPAAAANAFERGAQVPHSHPFLRVLAAAMAQHAGERQTARALWMTTYQTTDDKMIKENAVKHLRALDVDDEVVQLQQMVDDFTRKHGVRPQTMSDLVQAGYLRNLPVDPFGHPFKIVDGRVEVADLGALPFLTEGLPAGEKPQLLPFDSLKH